MASDPEYKRIWYQRKKAIAAGELIPEKKVKIPHAEYMKAYRQRLKKKAMNDPWPVKPRVLSDKALEEVVLRRGAVLSGMMNTPICMWPAEWLKEE